MKLASLLQPELIACKAKATSYDDAKRLLLGLLQEANDCAPEPLVTALEEREALVSTVVAPGIAFPHARTEAVDDFYLLIGCFPEGFAVEGQEQPVRFVSMFLMPEGASNLYLRSMSALARIVAKPELLEALVGAQSSDDLIERVDENGVLVKDVVTAQDIMTKEPPVVHVDATLRSVADLMVSQDVTHIPVVDDDNKYLGMISTTDLLAEGLPEYLLAMDTVDFLSEFEPFEDLLKKEQSTTAGEVMNTKAPVFTAHTPMIVVASKVVRDHITVAAVVEDNRLLGTISGLDFVHKVVRV